MSYLLIPLLCLLAATKITLQSHFSKSGGNDLFSKFLYNGIMFAAISLLFLPFLFLNGMSGPTALYGTLMGALSVLYQACYIVAFSKGSVTLTVIVNNFAMLLPTLFSVVAFSEPFGVAKGIGTALALASFCLTVSRDKRADVGKQKNHRLWAFLMLFVFFTNGLCSITQKIYAMHHPESFDPFGYVFIGYLVASLLTGLLLLCVRARKKNGRARAEGTVAEPAVQAPPRPHVSRALVLSAVGAGAALGVFQCLYTYSAKVLDGSVLYPAFNCATSVLLCLIGFFLVRERLSRLQYVGVILGLSAILLLCI